MSRIIKNRLSREASEYEVLQPIGEGGMASVYKAVQLHPPAEWVQAYGRIPRIVAIKFPHREMIERDDTFEDRFAREARLVSGIQHPNVIGVYEVGLDEDYQPFIVMQFIEHAVTLEDVVSKRYEEFYEPPREPGKIPHSLIGMRWVNTVFRQLLEGLRAIHAKGILHRDLKPDNVLITTDADGMPHVIIMDFGIAKQLESATSEETRNLTRGAALGTPYYMSPEHVFPVKPAKVAEHSEDELTVRSQERTFVTTYCPGSDLWSAGVIYFRLISGQVPYYHTDINFILAMIGDPNHPVPSVTEYVTDVNPAALTLIERCLVKDPEQRVRTAEEALALLDTVDEAEQLYERGLRLETKRADPAKAIPVKAIRTSKRPTMKSADYEEDPPEESVAGSADAHGRKTVAIVGVLAAALGIGVVFFLRTLEGTPNPAPSPSVVALGSTQTPSANPMQSASAAPSAVVSAVSQPLASASAPPARPASHKRKPSTGPRPSDRDVYRLYHRGLTAAHRGDCASAEADLSGVAAIYPTFPPPFKLLGDCARTHGHLDDARNYYKQYLSFEGVDPLPPEAQKLLDP